MARGFREILEILFRFSKKPTSITVEVANPLSGRGRASVCPLASVGRNPETLVVWLLSFQCLKGKSLHPSHGNTVTLMVGTLSGVGQEASRYGIGPHICLSLGGYDMCLCCAL